MKSVSIEKSNRKNNIIASIPHGSSYIIREMKKKMKDEIILTNNDWFLNELYDFLIELDITTVSANYSRYVIDVNRNIDKELHGKDYTESLIYMKTTFNKDIYCEPLLIEDIEKRINDIYLPYHSTLKSEIYRVLNKLDKVYLFDLHSFYAQSTADVVLGTKEGNTCSEFVLDIVYKAFISENFQVKVDEKGLRGGYIVSHYSTIDGVEAIQIELRYTKYIEDRFFGEEELRNKDDVLFTHTKEKLKRVFRKIKNELNKECM
ncbi:N-formylglutamate amidohydrolase [Halocella sp. SP3-1]|uniref:N-formylglutamate amidohydrolase n=1 Tax=Halocella sp. SP3-1 TaxID=2382161 RepID=UPI000F74F0DF|nr:N-formylglutamate amidohydrolase [Halocella sp. SP3-1]AZO94932.1 N-formylglutamate amidohydrolase [Halocella sp. SP3-1]